MKIDFSQAIAGLDGKPLKNGDEDMTLGFVSGHALNNPQLKPENALERGVLALKVFNAQRLTITPEEASLIRSCLPDMFAPAIVARAHEMLGGK